MAAASGLELVAPAKRNPLITTSWGTGELIRHALDAGVKHIIIGIGGSATNDGGAGMVQALGVKLLDAKAQPVGRAAANWQALRISILAGWISGWQTGRIEVACDVTNPLIGETGASAVFGPQKGATPEMIRTLDNALAHYAKKNYRPGSGY